MDYLDFVGPEMLCLRTPKSMSTSAVFFLLLLNSNPQWVGWGLPHVPGVDKVAALTAVKLATRKGFRRTAETSCTTFCLLSINNEMTAAIGKTKGKLDSKKTLKEAF